MTQLASIVIPAGRIECAWFEPPNPAPTDAAVLCLLHEGLGCVALWRDFPQVLANATGRRVFAWSRFGYGGSDTAALPRPVSYMHDEALHHTRDILDAAGIERCSLIGHSDGASIVAIYIGGTQDSRVESAVLMAPHFFCEDVSVMSIREARQAWNKGNLRERLERYHGDNVDSAFLGWNDAWQLPAFRDWNLKPYLDTTRVPVLAIQGKDDAYGTDAQVEIVLDRCAAQKRVLLLDDCSHTPHVDQSERVLREIDDWVDR